LRWVAAWEAIEPPSKFESPDAFSRVSILNTIVPSWIDTPMTEVALNGEAFMGKVLPRVSMRRWWVGDDFGGVAVYLASDASKYHTGDTFAIDGGYVIL
jgi:NAD(P)-dependent dehydrogenase (short-subunit alcohol dehydrogenase family)